MAITKRVLHNLQEENLEILKASSSFTSVLSQMLNFLFRMGSLAAIACFVVFMRFASSFRSKIYQLCILIAFLAFQQFFPFMFAMQSSKSIRRFLHRSYIALALWGCYLILLLGCSLYGNREAVSVVPTSLGLTLQKRMALPSYLSIQDDDIHSNTVANAAVMLGPYGTVKAPYSRGVDAALGYIVNFVAAQSHYVTSEEVSIVIPVRNEEDYLSDTIKFIFQNTPNEMIKEVIVVDDMSNIPVSSYLEKYVGKPIMKKVKILRNAVKEGLIRSRVFGANNATAENIFFLDGHCLPYKGWLKPLLKELQSNYKRLACPILFNVYKNWKPVGTRGTKMMFDWIFEFQWYEDYEVEIALSAGGIYAITKRWWKESEMYDMGMKEWGGENIEQSIRVWLCGGEIRTVEESHIGHIFGRPEKPNPNNELVIQVQKNQKRGAKVWLDEYYMYFDEYHREARNLNEGDITERLAVKKSLHCRPFQWYVDRFKTIMVRKDLIPSEYLHLQSRKSGLCLIASEDETKPLVTVALCNEEDIMQFWVTTAGNRVLYHPKKQKCLTADLNAKNVETPVNSPAHPVVYLDECDWLAVFRGDQPSQTWHHMEETGQLISYLTPDVRTLAGNDMYYLPPSSVEWPVATCLELRDLAHASLPVFFLASCYNAFDTSKPKNRLFNQQFDRLWIGSSISSRFG